MIDVSLLLGICACTIKFCSGMLVNKIKHLVIINNCNH